MALSALSAQLVHGVERACFDLVGHLQVGPLLLPASGAGLSAPASVTAPASHRAAGLGTARFAQPAPLNVGREPGKGR